MTSNTVKDAARLLYFGLNTQELPSTQTEYAELYDRYIRDADFAAHVRAVGIGLHLDIVDAGYHSGLVLVPRERNTLFAVSLTDYRKSLTRLSGTANTPRRAVLALMQIAVALTFFPTTQDLAAQREARPEADALAVAATLLELAQAAELAVGREQPLPATLRLAWQDVLGLPMTQESSSRPSVSSLAGMAELTLRHLAEQNLMRASELGSTEFPIYFASQRYQSLLQKVGLPEVFSAAAHLLGRELESEDV